MKKLILILLGLPFVGLAQDIENRMNDIKSMYKTSKSLHSDRTKSDCINVNWEEKAARPTEDYKQSATYCNYGEGYSRLTFEMSWWETRVTGEYYFYQDIFTDDANVLDFNQKDNLYFIYFVFSDSGPERKKVRLYFNEDGDPIKLISRGEYYGEEDTREVIIYNKEDLLEVTVDLFHYLQEAQIALIKR